MLKWYTVNRIFKCISRLDMTVNIIDSVTQVVVSNQNVVWHGTAAIPSI
jgi:hypothetical protein